MSEMSCLHCGARTSNGLALCDLCQTKARTDLEFLPIYFRNLARWRPPARPNGSLGTTGQWMLRRGETETSTITTALDQASNDLGTWARALHDDRPGFDLPEGDDETETFAATAEALSINLTSIGTLEWAGEFVTFTTWCEYALRSLTESYVPGWYAGACRRCSSPTYVVPGLTWMTCRTCGSASAARDHVETVLTEARDWVAPPKRLAEALVALLDDEDNIEGLRKRIAIWAVREEFETLRPTSYAPKRHRLGDVLDCLERKRGIGAKSERLGA